MNATEVISWLKQNQVPSTAHLCLDSRHLQAGDVFFACKGKNTDGHQFIEQAVTAGAVAIVAEAPLTAQVPVLVVPQLSTLLGRIAHQWYGCASEHMTVIAVTGTNGKTSSVQWLAAMLNNSGVACGTIGTLGVTLASGENVGGVLTTPDVLTMHRSLAAIYASGANLVALEASSIGLEQGRLDQVAIDIAAFTNLSHDHLDYHHNLQNYKAAKALLFNRPELRLAVANYDDEFGLQLLAQSPAQRCLSYSMQHAEADLVADDIHLGADGQVFRLVEAHGTAQILTQLLGKHNISNLLLVSAVLLELGWPVSKIARLMATLGPVAGRLEMVKPLAIGTHRPVPLAVVDYAHTPDALEHALHTLRKVAQVRGGKLWCVFGCGGDRDSLKRPQMGAVATQLADQVLITTDNPRTEDPLAIIQQIESGATAAATVGVDRAEAILQAIWSAEPNDLILIAGKGHETYQEIQHQQHFFDDRHWAQFALSWLRSPVLNTDSRRSQPGEIFVALRGAQFDGHDYVQAAKEQQAAVALVEHPVAVDIPQWVVGDTQVMLSKAARVWRQRFTIPIVAVTGSNGKTTTKEMIAAIFTQWLEPEQVLATAGNQNNELGVPLSVLKLNTTHKAAVFEIGMNHPGEILPLAHIVNPSIALVNNAQREHQEHLHSVAAVAAENGSVFQALTTEGVAVFPADDAYTEFWSELSPHTTLCFGLNTQATVHATDLYPAATDTRFNLVVDQAQAEVHLPVPGVHNLRNALAAAACAHAAGAPLHAMVAALNAFQAIQGRMQLIHFTNGVQLIDDSYNANPDSVRAAIDVLAQLNDKKILVLGNMAEVGIHSGAVHAEVGAYAKESGITMLLALGKDAQRAVAAFGEQAYSFEHIDELIAFLLQQMPAQCLVKGSRSARMERVVKALSDYMAENGHVA